MTPERPRPGINKSEQVQNGQRIVEPKRQFSATVIEKILSNRGEFEELYGASTTWQSKYDAAYVLIQDGRFLQDGHGDGHVDTLFLLKNFVPAQRVLQQFDDDKRKQVEHEAKTIGQELKGSIALLLMQKGILSPNDEDAKGVKTNVETQLGNEFNSKKAIQDLVHADVPIEVLGQIMTLDKFSSITDEKKIEELRSFVTNAILRPYIGTLAGRTQRVDLSVVDMMDRIPNKIFSHPSIIRYNLIEHYFAGKLMENVTNLGLEKGMRAIEGLVVSLDDPDKKRFMERIYNRFFDIATFPLEGDFKNKIVVKGQEREFPSFEQRAFCHDFINHGTRLLAAEVGLGKTAASYLAMENSDADKVLVLVPAKGRQTWQEQENVVFRHPNDVFIVKGESDLDKAIFSGKKYIVVSLELLGRTKEKPALKEKLHSLVKLTGIDGAIVDEIDNLSNPHAATTKTARSLTDSIRENYATKRGKVEGFDAPIIGLTATPIGGDLADLNVPMNILYPQNYVATVGEATETRKTFSDTCLNRPDLTYITLIGDRKMFRWESASGVQKFDYEVHPVQASPFEKLLHDFINSGVGVDALNKIRLLENALFNPLLVKAEVRKLASDKIPEIDLDQVLEILKKVVTGWKNIKGIDAPRDEVDADYLSADRLVELGLDDTVLGCFFSGVLENGIDTLVEELTQDTSDLTLADLRLFWKSRDVSTKYQTVNQMLEEALTWKVMEDGKTIRDKVIIVSPSKKQGRTGDVLQRQMTSENGDGRNLYERHELDSINDSKLHTLVKEWTKDVCRPEDVLLIDGSVTLGKKRDSVISRWVNDPNAAVMIVTLEAAYQSRDFTINNLVDEENREISGIHKIFLGPPWDFRQLKQMAGRSQRQMQKVPVRNTVLQVDESVEQGKGEVVQYTRFLSRMALSGVVLSPEDQDFFDSKRVGSRVLRYKTPEQRFLRDAFNFVRGAGEDQVDQFMVGKDPKQEKNNYQRFAERFFDEGRDEYKTSGYNAELVASLIKKYNLLDGQILSIGAGTLLLQRKLKRGIDNVDMNPYIMEVGWERAKNYGGRMIAARASHLDHEQFQDVSYDCIDCAFTLQWSKLSVEEGKGAEESERVKILSQINRVLKQNGAFILTLPEGELDDDKFQKFGSALESHFGFRVDQEYSGKSFGISKLGITKRLGWCIYAQKMGEIDVSGLNLDDLAFMGDDREWLSRYTKDKNGKEPFGNNGPAPTIQLKFDEYQIVNPGKALGKALAPDEDYKTSKKTGVDVQPAHDDTQKIEVLSDDSESSIFQDCAILLRGTTEKDFDSYKKDLMRPLRRITGWSWEENEAFCIRTLAEMKQKGRVIDNRIIAFSWILKVAKRQLGERERR